ncbi:transporter, MFS superfamily [[Actinomadura] parvosata subsp. kistnae]|uniref:MFS transporter n=1 Tax=[Actinomadura] parvosata subsp. kistnae TaxID=1909395 RepID=A0A1V0A047_9ACTN|nr:MFS transporter [Nonomuraea sp. ATCC 55076]AQZ63557.1 MFS transporter [Nonomuraea sp. ATCC 55076]SPL99317.1 transporter, MFS superfamily [Actinomadura parvosata subsp. kistnae]
MTRTARYRWVILGVATFTQAATGFFVQGIGAMSVHLQRDLELNTTQLGLLLSAAQLLPLAGLLVAGRLLDRHDERWVVGIGALVVAAALALAGVAPGYLSLLAVLLIVGAGYSTIQPGGSKSVASWFGASQRGLAMGIRQAGLPLGGALAAFVLPAMAAAYGWRSTVLAGAVIALAGAVAFMTLYRRPPNRRPVPATSRVRLELLREPYMKKIVLSGTSMVSVHSGLGVLTVLYLHEVTSLSAAVAALVYVAVQCAGALGRICLAAWSDRHAAGRYACVLTCLIAVIIGMLALTTPLGRSPVAACLLFVWLGFFGIGWYGPWITYAAESAPPDHTGFALGLAMAVNQVAIVLAPFVLGLLTDLTGGFAPAWILLSALTAVTLVATVRL